MTDDWTTYQIVRCAFEAALILIAISGGLMAYAISLERRLANLSARLAVIPDLLSAWNGIMCDLTEIRTKLGMHNSEGNPARTKRLNDALEKITGEIPVVKGPVDG